MASELEKYVLSELKPTLDMMGITSYHFIAKDPDEPGVHFLRGQDIHWIYGALSEEVRGIGSLWDNYGIVLGDDSET